MKSSSHPNRRPQEETPSRAPPSQPHREDERSPFTIYASPTVDTLEEVPRTHRHGRSMELIDMRTSSGPPKRETTPPRKAVAPKVTSPSSKQSSPAISRSSAMQYPTRAHSRLKTNVSSVSTPKPPRPVAAEHARRKKRKPRDFQHEEDVMTVAAREIDVATRTAFEPLRPISIEEWHAIALEAEQTRKISMRKRLSPSLQHLELLHKMQHIKNTRQLAFSPSVGLDSDIFVPWDEDLPDYQGHSSNMRRRGRKIKRDGRYRSIDPVKATRDALPPHPPVLSNRKYRLPMRSDVGFPNASETEIRRKEQEIAHETEWEEASPRLVVLVTSDDLGTAVQDEPPSQLLPQHERWNGGGLEGMPLAGRELMMAKERNLRLFARGSSSSSQHAWKPNLTSMLAPPLDATYSSTLGWRPRPFHDRLPGMINCIICPTQVHFDIGNIEPLVGTLALYSLPVGPRQNGDVHGKMSEEFYFPAGDWNGRVNLDAARTETGAIDPMILQSWLERKHKALVSYDPLLVCGGRPSLHVVLQLYKVTQPDAVAPYLVAPRDVRKGSEKGGLQKSKSIGRRIKSKLGKMGKGADESADDFDVNAARARARSVLDTFGTQFLTPLCFGVVPFYPPKVNEFNEETEMPEMHSDERVNMSWPDGATQAMDLHPFPLLAESQDEFLERLIGVVSGESTVDKRSTGQSFLGGEYEVRAVASDVSHVTENGDDDPSENKSLAFSASFPPHNATPVRQAQKTMSTTNTTSHSKRSSKFLKFQKASTSPSITSATLNERRAKDQFLLHEEHQEVIAGTASIFTSVVGVDFTQSMLQTPPALEETEISESKLPRLLVDVTGDCAIMMNPVQSHSSTASSAFGAETSRKRSDLVRLPISSTPSGFAAVSEVRELLPLPPRAEKQYDVDGPLSYRSCLNLLYLYPCNLRLPSDVRKSDLRSSTKGRQSSKHCRSYSVRIQLVRSSVEVNEETGELESYNVALPSFYNPAPWAGPSMLNAMYTKIPISSKGKQAQGDITKEGVVLRDEIKLRLPMVLDGNYFLQFTLFALDFRNVELSDDDIDSHAWTDCGVDVDSIAETTIPLSSSSTREASSGVRVTTIIPNGCHRLKLGEFQLLLETRLVSSIHVGDPTVATALRDFPFSNDYDDPILREKLKELALIPSRSIVGRSPTSEPIVDLKVPFHNLFAAASENSLFGHFPIFVYMHLSNLVNRAMDELSVSHLTEFSEDVESDEESDVGYRNTHFTMDNMKSLFELFRKAKLKFAKQSVAVEADKRRSLFIKGFIDSFDEAVLTSRDSKQSPPGDDLSMGLRMERTESALSMNTPDKTTGRQATRVDFVEDDDEDDVTDGGAIRLRRKTSMRTEIDLRIARTVSALGVSGIPFSRVAYGASKTDRMRVEAELHHEGGRFTHLFDDDETVVTYLQSVNDKQPPESTADRQEPRRKWDVAENEAIQHDEKVVVAEVSKVKPPVRSLGDSNFAKRVRTVAQVMIAPCVAPSLSTVLATGTGGSPVKSNLEGTQGDQQQPTTHIHILADASRPTAAKLLEGPGVTADERPGSDAEEEEEGTQVTLNSLSPRHSVTTDATDGILRAPAHHPALSFTISSQKERGKKGVSLQEAVPFIYEITMIMWLKVWLDHVSSHSGNVDAEASTGSDGEVGIVLIPPYDPSVPHQEPIIAFHAHMDILLPLCLKSFLLRCKSNLAEGSPTIRMTLDGAHMQVFEPFVEMLVRGLFGEALHGSNDRSESEPSLVRALISAQVVLEFLVGLATVLHPFHTSVLIGKYFKTLREFETRPIDGERQDSSRFIWDEDSLRRVRCSRQLRLRAVEHLATMPNFVGMNYPLKYAERASQRKTESPSWTSQRIRIPLPSSSAHASPYADGLERLPRSGWLADLLAGESLSICSLSCEAVVAEAMAQIETIGNSTSNASSLRDRPGISLNREDLLQFQSTAIHAINCVYELLLRRHSMDSRFQTEQARSRIAALFAPAILEKSLGSVRWLARMEATHKVRSLWLLCFMYILQEAPDALIRSRLHSYCCPEDFPIHRFIRLLRLSSSTFQSFIDQPQHSSFPAMIAKDLSPWLLQESFNTICAATNVLVDECAQPISSYPKEEKKMTQGVLDLLLHILTVPQSAVTHLRTVGSTLQALNKVGIELFLEIVGASLEHWVRVILTLMNSMSLSVRSVAVDFVVSLMGETFKLKGNVDEIGIIFATVIPEVVAREIALYSVNGLITRIEHVESAVWPLRRALADVEEANPLDDVRVDLQLAPILSTICRTCQAIIDGVLVELRLRGNECHIVGCKVQTEKSNFYTFDADEESLYEAANFFVPETAPLQRLRWLLTLKRLHESKCQWVEAAETLVLCARTISDAIPHLKSVWRPSRFVLWRDNRRSLWLSTVGKDMGHPDRGNVQVMEFADSFLEPTNLLDDSLRETFGMKLPQPTVPALCSTLSAVAKEAVSFYLQEVGMDELAFSRLEALLRVIMNVLEDHGSSRSNSVTILSSASRKRLAEEAASLRRVSASLNGDLTKLAERLLLIAQDETPNKGASIARNGTDVLVSPKVWHTRHYYVRVLLSGKKPNRFKESTTIPTFLEWNNSCICRVPKTIVASAIGNGANDPKMAEERICGEYGRSLRDALNQECPEGSVMFRTGGRVDENLGDNETATTFLDVSIVYMDLPFADGAATREEDMIGFRESKRFFYRKSSSSELLPTLSSGGQQTPELLPGFASNLVELTVAHRFPCALSRQRTLLTSEFLSEA